MMGGEEGRGEGEEELLPQAAGLLSSPLGPSHRILPAYRVHQILCLLDLPPAPRVGCLLSVAGGYPHAGAQRSARDSGNSVTPLAVPPAAQATAILCGDRTIVHR